MVAVRERIRIDGVPIEEGVFAKYFFEVWDKLERGVKVSLGWNWEKGGRIGVIFLGLVVVVVVVVVVGG